MPLHVEEWYDDPDKIKQTVLWMEENGFSAEDIAKFIRNPKAHERLHRKAKADEAQKLEQQKDTKSHG